MTRLAVQPTERIDRVQPVSFTWDGRTVSGYAGDTIASALIASGQQVLSRSFKYHRPRGELCGCGQCANSLVTVDGRPGVRACREPIAAGMRVEHQNAWPSLKLDVMAANDRFAGPFTPPGFYYKAFIRPRRLWPVYETVLRHAAGLGRLRRRQDDREWRTDYRRRHCDVLVVGGGVAGLAAARRAAELGADVVLCDDDVEPGGALLFEGGRQRARALADEARAAGVEILSGATALGFFDGLVPVWQGSTLHQVRAARFVAATGGIEQPLVFPDNDLPGVMLSGGALRMAALYGVAAGRRAVVAATGDAGLHAALGLLDAGIALAAVADLRDDGAVEGGPLELLRSRGVDVATGCTVVRARGRLGVQEVVLARVDGQGRAVGGSERRVECDLLAVNGPSVPTSSLLLQSGARARYDAGSGRFVADGLPPGVHAAGAVAGHETADAAELSGTVAGADAVASLTAAGVTFGDRAVDGADGDAERAALDQQPAPRPVAVPPAVATDGGKGKAFVDLDEDVTVKDVAYAAAEGFDSIELSKRYTTVTMGPSQGRFSQLASIRALAAATGQPVADIGLTTARPPWTAVPLGVLAGRPIEPAKRSAIHGRHRELGATERWAGEWRRAYDYGDPQAEALAVHRAAGLIDVSTLGKLIVRGPDAGELLDRLYPNRISNLAVDRVRYGVVTSDAGRIVDDGTICRLDDDTFYVTTTSSGAGAMEDWFTWWQTAWDLDARITDVTQGLAAMNLAGPKARAVMAGVCDLDCSAEAFAYMDARHAAIAGVPCLAMRIGFVGEVGYEIHCAAAYGEHLWDAILAAGAEHGIRPFGLEPQRILRLQKLHILVGQDTDSESTPYGAAMPWAVKLDKEQDFIGRWALEHAAEHPGPAALVGFTLPDGDVPTEGAVVLHQGRPAGQVTSARFSPLLKHTIGMAWVPSVLADDGASITISDAGRTLQAEVRTRPFYDPDGAVLRG